MTAKQKQSAKPKHSAKAHGDWRTKLYEQDVTYWSDDDLIRMLTDRYAPPGIPPCHICGAELSMSRCGGGPMVYACSGLEVDPVDRNYLISKPGRSLIDAHYMQSKYIDHKRGGDDVVKEMIARFRKTGK